MGEFDRTDVTQTDNNLLHIQRVTGTVRKVRRELKNCVRTETLHGPVHWTRCTAASSRWNMHSIFSRLGLPLTNLSITWLLSAGNQLLRLNDSR